MLRLPLSLQPSKGQAEQYNDGYYQDGHRNWLANPDLELFGWGTTRLAELPVGSRALDIGGGRGTFLRYRQEKRPDLQLDGLELAELNPEEGITFIAEDLLAYRPDGSFAAAGGISAIEHLLDPKEFSGRLVGHLANRAGRPPRSYSAGRRAKPSNHRKVDHEHRERDRFSNAVSKS